MIEGGGHCVQARHPVRFNLVLRRFADDACGLMRAPLNPSTPGGRRAATACGIHYEVFGSGTMTVLLMGTFPVVDGRQWKAQVPYLARHYRVITDRRPRQRAVRASRRTGRLRR